MSVPGFQKAKQYYAYIAAHKDGVLVSDFIRATGYKSCKAALFALLDDNGFLVYLEDDPDGKHRIHAWKEVDRTVRPQKSFPNYWSTNFLNIPANAKD